MKRRHTASGLVKMMERKFDCQRKQNGRKRHEEMMPQHYMLLTAEWEKTILQFNCEGLGIMWD